MSTDVALTFRTCNAISLQSDSLARASRNTDVATLCLCLRTPWHWFYQWSVFRVLVICDHSPPATVLNVSSVARFSFCLILHPKLMLHMPIYSAPFLHHGLPICTWYCEPLPQCPSCWLSSLFQRSSLCRFLQLAVSSAPSSADKIGASLSFSQVPMFGRRII